ncbi:hypothetical protein LMIY3S_02824 [Labrys miyagiensis]
MGEFHHLRRSTRHRKPYTSSTFVCVVLLWSGHYSVNMATRSQNTSETGAYVLIVALIVAAIAVAGMMFCTQTGLLRL